ncbi:MAG: HAMP domain-containing sensor histidine kinase [Pseudomonadota bacterium]
MSREANLEDLEIHPITLRFRSTRLEEGYIAAIFAQSLSLLRLALLSGIMIIVIYFPIDRQILGEEYHVMWWVRAAVIIPGAILIYAFTYSRYFEKYSQWPFSLLVLSAGLSMCFGIVWYGEAAAMYFVPGSVMCIMYGFVLFGLRFIPAMLTCWTIVLADIVAILSLPLPADLSLNGLQVLLLSCTILSIGVYKMERVSRISYYKSAQLIEAQGQRQEVRKRRIEWLELLTNFFRHEVRTHIAGLKTSLELLTRHADSAPLHRYIDNAKKSLHIVDYILKSVSYATSIESTFYKEASSSVALGEVVSERVEYYQNYSYPSCRIVYEGDDLPMHINGRRERVIQLLDNLVSNAVVHHRERTPIVVSLKSRENVAILRVANEGPALPENKKALFDLFYSIQHHDYQGEHQGLGLYIVKLIADRYAGSVEAENRQDVSGAIFRVTLPCIT